MITGFRVEKNNFFVITFVHLWCISIETQNVMILLSDMFDLCFYVSMILH